MIAFNNNGTLVELAGKTTSLSAVCATAAATAAKTITISDFSQLTTGTTIRVQFTNGNSAASPTLQVNSLAAKPICSYGSNPITAIQAGAALNLYYDGTSWIALGRDKNVFEGTTEQWSQLSTAQKKTYDVVVLTDDYDPAEVGDLTQLHTTDKTSLVAAINEIADRLDALGLSVVNGQINYTYNNN